MCTLQSIAILSLLTNDVKNGINQLSAFCIMSLGPVITGAGLAKYEIIRPEDLTVGTRSDAVHGTRLQIHKNGTGNVTAAGGFIVVNIDALELEIGGGTVVLAGGINSVLVADDLPKLCADLVAALASLCVHHDSLQLIHKSVAFRLTQQNRIPVLCNLIQRGVRVESNLCYICQQEEGVEHLFFKCRHAMELWQWFIKWAGIQTIPSSCSSLMDVINSLKGKRERKMTGTLLYAVIWLLWKDRNEAAFRKRRVYPMRTADEVQVVQCYSILPPYEVEDTKDDLEYRNVNLKIKAMKNDKSSGTGKKKKNSAIDAFQCKKLNEAYLLSVIAGRDGGRRRRTAPSRWRLSGVGLLAGCLEKKCNRQFQFPPTPVRVITSTASILVVVIWQFWINPLEKKRAYENQTKVFRAISPMIFLESKCGQIDSSYANLKKHIDPTPIS
ncbi:hypothetical protein LXL04_035710 [Taraxacum kok-saghyz]